MEHERIPLDAKFIPTERIQFPVPCAAIICHQLYEKFVVFHKNFINEQIIVRLFVFSAEGFPPRPVRIFCLKIFYRSDRLRFFILCNSAQSGNQCVVCTGVKLIAAGELYYNFVLVNKPFLPSRIFGPVSRVTNNEPMLGIIYYIPSKTVANRAEQIVVQCILPV